jgi:transposase
MRGSALRQLSMLSAVTPDELVPLHHPIRRVQPMVERALDSLAPTFDAMYAEEGRPSIPPEHLLKGCLLMALYSIRSERQFCERLQYDLLFKWFLGLNVSEPAFDHSSFAKNRRRLLDHAVSRAFFEAVLFQAREQHLLSNDHFTVDGTLLESWASLKSFKPKGPNLGGQRKPKRGGRRGGGPPAGGDAGRNPEVNFRGQRRSNETHYSATDPEARLARKGNGREAKLCLAGHVLMENRNGLVVDVELNSPSGNAEREAAHRMLRRMRKGRRRLTVAGDKNFDTRDFVAGCRELNITPHVAQNQNRRRSTIDGRTVRHLGYSVSQRWRKRVEEIFGWWKTVAGGRKLRYVGLKRNRLWVELTCAAYNLVRMANLCPATA